MTPESEALELGELRRRAYGPDGGLSAQEARRLAQLEDAARRAAPRVSTAAADAAEADGGEPVDDDPFAGMWVQAPSSSGVVASGQGTAVIDGPAAPTAQTPRRTGVLIAVGADALVCGLLIGWVVGALGSGLARRPADLVLRPLATPPADENAVMFVGLGDAELSYFEPYGALTVVERRREGEYPCLIIATKEETEGFMYPIAYGCAAEDWPATVDVSPLMWGGDDPLLAEITDGRAIRFELVDDVVEVRTGAIETD